MDPEFNITLSAKKEASESRIVGRKKIEDSIKSLQDTNSARLTSIFLKASEQLKPSITFNKYSEKSGVLCPLMPNIKVKGRDKFDYLTIFSHFGGGKLPLINMKTI